MATRRTHRSRSSAQRSSDPLAGIYIPKGVRDRRERVRLGLEPKPASKPIPSEPAPSSSAKPVRATPSYPSRPKPAQSTPDPPKRRQRVRTAAAAARPTRGSKRGSRNKKIPSTKAAAAAGVPPPAPASERSPAAGHSIPPLVSASKAGDEAAVRVELGRLKAKGIAVDKEMDARGWSALMWASSKGHAGVVQMLIHSGASLDLAGPKDWTPLMAAEAGADPALVDAEGNSVHQLLELAPEFSRAGLRAALTDERFDELTALEALLAKDSEGGTVEEAAATKPSSPAAAEGESTGAHKQEQGGAAAGGAEDMDGGR